MSPSRIAVKIVFFLNGFVHANYFSRLPRIQEQFSIDNVVVGLVLLSSSIGALIAMPFTGWLISGTAVAGLPFSESSLTVP